MGCKELELFCNLPRWAFGNFQFSAKVNNSVVNILVHVFWWQWDSFLLGIFLGSGVAGLSRMLSLSLHNYLPGWTEAAMRFILRKSPRGACAHSEAPPTSRQAPPSCKNCPVTLCTPLNSARPSQNSCPPRTSECNSIRTWGLCITTLRWSSYLVISVLRRERGGAFGYRGRDTPGECLVKKEAEIGVMGL